MCIVVVQGLETQIYQKKTFSNHTYTTVLSLPNGFILYSTVLPLHNGFTLYSTVLCCHWKAQRTSLMFVLLQRKSNHTYTTVW